MLARGRCPGRAIRAIIVADDARGALPEGGRAAPGGVPPADGGRAGRRHRALPAVDRAPPHRRGAHLPRLDLQLPGAARGRDRAVQGGDRGRCRLRQSVQRHRLVPDQARASRRGDSLARVGDQGAALRAAPLPALQPGAGLLGAGAAREGGGRVRARARDRAGVSVRARGAGGDPQAAELGAGGTIAAGCGGGGGPGAPARAPTPVARSRRAQHAAPSKVAAGPPPPPLRLRSRPPPPPQKKKPEPVDTTWRCAHG